MSRYDMRFHRRIGFPDGLHIPTGRFQLYHSDHSEKRSNDNEYGEFEIPDSIYVDMWDIVEVKTRDGEVWRMLFRLPYDKQYDICIVLNVDRNEVITTWRNEIQDKHEELDMNLYNHPNEYEG